jgi:polyphosphate kinase
MSSSASEGRSEMKPPKASSCSRRRSELTKRDCEWLREIYFHERTSFPILTPLAIDPSHPFPFLPNLGFTIGFTCSGMSDGEEQAARARADADHVRRFIRAAEGQQGVSASLRWKT